MVTKGPFMEFIAGALIMSAANTYTEIELPTPASKSEKLAMLIHQITMGLEGTLDVPAVGDSVTFQVTKTTKSAEVFDDDSDLLAKFKLIFSALTEGGNWIEASKERNFIPPILYAKSKIFFAMVTVGQTGADQGGVRIGYTLDKVSEVDFISALTD